MEPPAPPGFIVPVPETDLEAVALTSKGEDDDASGSRADQGGAPPDDSDPARTYRATDDGGVAETTKLTVDSGFLLRVKMKRQASRAKVSLRQKRRGTYLDALAQDKQLYPHLLDAEIISLGQLFEEYADENSTGVLHINQAAVKKMLDDALQFLYEKIDIDRSGTLDKKEVRTLLEALGYHASRSELVQVMAELDADNDDKVDCKEFKEWWMRRQYETEENQERELQDLFAVVDKDGSGQIDWHEFLQLIACVQPHASSHPESQLDHLRWHCRRCARTP